MLMYEDSEEYHRFCTMLAFILSMNIRVMFKTICLKVLRHLALKPFFNHQNVICPSNFINAMK